MNDKHRLNLPSSKTLEYILHCCMILIKIHLMSTYLGPSLMADCAVLKGYVCCAICIVNQLRF